MYIRMHTYLYTKKTTRGEVYIGIHTYLYTKKNRGQRCIYVYTHIYILKIQQGASTPHRTLVERSIPAEGGRHVAVYILICVYQYVHVLGGGRNAKGLCIFTYTHISIH